MKILRVLFLSLAGLAALPASAGIPVDAAPAAPQSTSVLAVRALITRCLPAVAGRHGVPSAGLRRAGEELSARILRDRPGRVWSDRSGRLLLISHDDVPVCRVFAARVDPAVFADLVVKVFREQDTPFMRRRFRLDPDGALAAVYTMTGRADALVLRISTAQDESGRHSATLSIERDIQDPGKVSQPASPLSGTGAR